MTSAMTARAGPPGLDLHDHDGTTSKCRSASFSNQHGTIQALIEAYGAYQAFRAPGLPQADQPESRVGGQMSRPSTVGSLGPPGDSVARLAHQRRTGQSARRRPFRVRSDARARFGGTCD
jgi:hypothetical protein